ncbi:RNA recognition motif domain-containing protein [Ditylenchus destructor]|uniref:RNA recognition motif domain-containing protein n=1 Tax=Ditylenchus destructor TaxID=166010 RepID=A0AAD4MUM8_9BILA|nr:RNA recognition motif domain-containing protein [Ditylenchus destructor]
MYLIIIYLSPLVLTGQYGFSAQIRLDPELGPVPSPISMTGFSDWAGQIFDPLQGKQNRVINQACIAYQSRDLQYSSIKCCNFRRKMAQINGYGYADACIEQEPADESQTNLVVNYLPIDLTQEELSHLFGLVGELKQCRLIMDKTTGKNMGYGFITYVNAEHAKNAIVAYNGYKVHDKNIKICALKKEDADNAIFALNGSSPDGSNSNLLQVKYATTASQKANQQQVVMLPGGPGGAAQVIIKGPGAGSVPQVINPMDPRVAARASYSGYQTQYPAPGPIHSTQPTNGNHRYAPMGSMPNGRGAQTTYEASSAGMGSGAQSAVIYPLYINNLDPDTENLELALYRIFSPIGPIFSIRVVTDPTTKKCKGYAFINMLTYEGAVEAIALRQNYFLGSKNIQVSFKTQKGY